MFSFSICRDIIAASLTALIVGAVLGMAGISVMSLFPSI